MTGSAPAVAPVYAPAAARRTNGLAIASFVFALLGFAIIPVALGHVAVAQIKRSGDGGTAFAVIGLVLGYIQVVVIVMAIVLTVSGVGFAVFAGLFE